MAGLGGWRPLGFRGYVDTTADISSAMDKLLIEDFDPDESDEEERAFFLCGVKTPLTAARCTMGDGVFRVKSLRGFCAF